MVSYGDHHQQPPINQQHRFLSVQKPPSKKPPSSASASTKPRVYNVKPIHFRELVQRLTTGTSQPQPQPPSQRIQSAPPPPIQLVSHPTNFATTVPSSAAMPLDPTAGEYLQRKSTEDGFSLSPSSCSWFSFPLLSPGPLSNFGA